MKILQNSVLLILSIITFASCQKDGNPNNLADVSKADYEGTIEGYKSSDDVFSKNLVAYWPFEENENEVKSNTAITLSANNALVDGGIKGKALSLNGGFLYYAQQLDAFKTDTFKSFTLSTWIQIQNNGLKRTMVFQLTKPNSLDGNINLILNTNSYPATEVSRLVIQPTFADVFGGFQDNLNAPWLEDFRSPKIGENVWSHILLTYDAATGIFNIWGDGMNIGSYSNRGVGNSSFRASEPSELIIGANYNAVPGKLINNDVSFGAMQGKIDEIRIYNISLPAAQIQALYKLGRLGK